MQKDKLLTSEILEQVYSANSFKKEGKFKKFKKIQKEVRIWADDIHKRKPNFFRKHKFLRYQILELLKA